MTRQRHAIGQAIPQLNAPAKATGQTRYADDLVFPGMLWGKILRSPYPHARISSIDTARARRLPGVKAIVTGAETPGARYCITRSLADKQMLAVDKVRHIGDEIAAVAAASEDVAEEALSLIRVEFEQLPPVFDPLQAMAEGAPQIHEHAPGNVCVRRLFRFGDVDEGFRRAYHVRQDRFTTQIVIHAAIETHVCVAVVDAVGRVKIWTPTQLPFLLRRDLARTLNIPQHRVRVVGVPIGGAFGGKGEMFSLEFAAVLLSQATGRPVKICYDRQEEFIGTHRRLPMAIELCTAVDREGRLLAQRSQIIADGGAYAGTAAIAAYNSGLAHLLPYRLPALCHEGIRVYTNKPACGAQRGHAQNQPRFAIECQLDMLAEDLGIDPVDIRLRNSLEPGDITINGLQITSCGLSEAIERAAAGAGWRQKRRRNEEDGHQFCRGIGIAAGGFVCGARQSAVSASGATIKLEEGGSLTLLVGAADLGQGSDTVLAQIAAEALGVDVDRITVVSADTETTPYDPGSCSSRVTFYSGNAVLRAALELKRRIADAVALTLQVSSDDLEFHDNVVEVPGRSETQIPFAQAAHLTQTTGQSQVIVQTASYCPDSVEWPDRKTQSGNVAAAYSFSAQVAEVEVDRGTGRVRVDRMILADDSGFRLNPLLADGQAHGATSMGIGQALYEEIVLDDGSILNPSFLDYGMPLAVDAPAMETVSVTTNDPEGPFGAKEIGEGFIVSTAPAIVNAIHDAIGVWITDLPATPERILSALTEHEAHSNP